MALTKKKKKKGKTYMHMYPLEVGDFRQNFQTPNITEFHGIWSCSVTRNSAYLRGIWGNAVQNTEYGSKKKYMEFRVGGIP